MAKTPGSSGNATPVSPKVAPTLPAAPGMGNGAPRTVKGPKVDPRSKPVSRGMGGTAGLQPGRKPGMGRG